MLSQIKSAPQRQGDACIWVPPNLASARPPGVSSHSGKSTEPASQKSAHALLTPDKGALVSGGQFVNSDGVCGQMVTVVDGPRR